MKNLKKKSFCDLSPKKIKKHKEELVSLIQNPNYLCKNCGHASASDRNLCKPELIQAKQ